MAPTIVQAVWGAMPPVLMPMVADTAAFAARRGYGYRLVEIATVPVGYDAVRIAADVYRVRMLAEDAGAIWCDLDCVPHDTFEYADDGKPHCAYYPGADTAECKAQPDAFLCYGPCAWWRNVLHLHGARIATPCGIRKVLRDNADIVQIPAAQYAHAMYTINKAMKCGRCGDNRKPMEV